jgi:predicted nucleic acid-binding protein
LLGKLLTQTRAREVIVDYLDLPLSRHGHEALVFRILELASNFSSYDACYVSLAERLDASLLTADRALARSVQTHLQVPVIGPGASGP